MVLRRNYVLSWGQDGFGAKLVPRYKGPHYIHKKIGDITYQLVDEDGKNSGNWHVKDLKSFQKAVD